MIPSSFMAAKMRRLFAVKSTEMGVFKEIVLYLQINILHQEIEEKYKD